MNKTNTIIIYHIIFINASEQTVKHRSSIRGQGIIDFNNKTPKGKAMDKLKRFEQAVKILPPRLSGILMSLSGDEKNSIREICFRSEKAVVAVTETGVRFLHESGRLTQIYSSFAVKTDCREIEEMFHRLCGYSVYSFRDAINRGFITVDGGHRAGVAGTAVTENGKVTAVRDICCINLRIAREIKGSADGIFSRCFSDGISGLIVAGPPSSGKTTVLRDLARQISGDGKGLLAKVFVCDERGEIGAMHCGKPQNDLGVNCDIITSYPKSEGILIGLRSFSPDIIICDEIATDEEADAVESGLCSGVEFVLSMHAGSEKELRSKPLVKRLLHSGCFENVVLLSSGKDGRNQKFFKAGDLLG